MFDSHYDPYKGVVAYVRLAAGTLRDHERVRFMATGAESEILELGYFRPQAVPSERLVAGEVGRLVVTHKDRLLRFGAELVFAICAAKEVEVVIVNRGEDTTFEDDRLRSSRPEGWPEW